VSNIPPIKTYIPDRPNYATECFFSNSAALERNINFPFCDALLFSVAILLILNTPGVIQVPIQVTIQIPIQVPIRIPESKHNLRHAPHSEDKLASNDRRREKEEDGECIKFVFHFLLLLFTFASLSRKKEILFFRFPTTVHC